MTYISRHQNESVWQVTQRTEMQTDNVTERDMEGLGMKAKVRSPLRTHKHTSNLLYAAYSHSQGYVLCRAFLLQGSVLSPRRLKG